MQEQILNDARDYIRNLFSEDSGGHDYWHSIRVANTARQLAMQEGADAFLAELAALLHDADDIKLFPDTFTEKKHAVDFLRSHAVPEDVIRELVSIIEQIPFNGTGLSVPDSLEGKCVQDADRLDAIGAIGIARTFAYGGSHGRAIFDPEEKPRLHMTADEYRKASSYSISHFYEKLLKIKDLMNTESGKKAAAQRDSYMRAFLKEFYSEWGGTENNPSS